MENGFLFDGPADANITILLAHGAGAPMDAALMNTATEALVAVGFRIARFEFDYMAARRAGQKKPSPKAELVMPEYVRAVERLRAKGRLIIGGKSMGGRVASMIADDLHAEGKVAGLLCLGYPFHPPDKPEELRTAHLAKLKTPTLIVQGACDPYGKIEEVPGYTLSDQIQILWLEGAHHDLTPRKKNSGSTTADNMAAMAHKTRDWADSL